METKKKFTLDKFQVAKLKNLKKIIGGDVTNDGGTVYTTTGNDNDRDSSIRCTF